MKKVLMILAASMLATSLPALAADHSHNGHDEKCIKECQMLVKNCGQELDTIQQRITRLNSELGKGTSVYTTEELRILDRKLQDAQDTLANLTMGG